jgi:hypothetical protein
MNQAVCIPHDHKVTEASLTDVEDIVDFLNRSFNRILNRLCGGAPDVGEGDRIRDRLTRKDCRCLVLRNHQDAVVGVCLIQVYGKNVVLGPIAVRAAAQGKDALLTAGFDYLREHGLGDLEFITFPHSTLHFKTYWTANQAFDLGLDLVSPALFLTRRLRPGVAAQQESVSGADTAQPLTWLSQSTGAAREAQLQAIRKLNHTSPAGIDNDTELRHLLATLHGDILLYGTTTEPLGYAACTSGPGSEAFESQQLLVKTLLIDGPSCAEKARHLVAMTTAIEDLARARQLQDVGIMVNGLHRNMLNAFLANEYRVSSIFQLWTTRAAEYTDAADRFCAMELR